MLALLPIITLCLLALLIGNRDSSPGWRLACLRAGLIVAGYAILSLEMLSLFQGISQISLGITWALPLLVLSFWLIRLSRTKRLHLPVFPRNLRWDEWVLVSLGLLMLAATISIALLAPPQTYDSLNYHMPRVAHWWQERSIGFFATGIEKQNIYPPGAEFLVLHLYTLAGNDHLVNLISWLSYLGSGIAASLVCARLGVKRTGQLFAVAFVLAIPMAIAQSSSTMNDIVAGFWLTCAALETVNLWKSGSARVSTPMAGLAAALAILTKPTVLPYLAPIGLLHLILLLRQGWRGNLMRGFGALVLILAINAGFWARSLQVYGSLADTGTVSSFANNLNQPAVIVSNLLRNAGLQAWTPWPEVNEFVFHNIYKAHVKLGLALDDPASTYGGTFQVRVPSWNEDLISNPLAAALSLVCMLLVFLWIRRDGWAPVTYAVVIALGFVVYSGLFKWQIFAGRLMLPFFLVFAPICGYVLGKMRPPVLISAAATLCLVLAWPALTGIASRPLLPIPGSSLTGSILSTTREELRYANIQSQQAIDREMSNLIQAAGCSQVGVALQGDGAEYPFWTLLGAPTRDLTISWLVAGTPSASLADPNFKPCAVICSTCLEPSFRDLPLAYDQAGNRLYMKNP